MQRLGRYEILQSLGTGSMGIVYRAWDSVLDREVALKTIRTGAEVEPELRERFHREAKACARLQHPGIVSVFDLGEIDHTAFIAMELLTGQDLRKTIDQNIEVALLTKLEAMISVCEALAHAHRHGIIHRDLKPSNLFLLEDGRAKVLDFGIARLPSSQLTVAGKILGTPNYMAPEQILSKPAGVRSDLFSASLVFFEFLTGKHPFQAQLIPKRIVEGEPDSIFDYDSKLPAPLDQIFMRALAKDPEKRYRTGDQMATDLAVLVAALRGGAPTFSHIQLPATNGDLTVDAVRPHRVVDPSLVKEAPPGEDPYEWRASEVLRLLPEFEGAVERRDIPQAKRLFSELEAIESVDPRFSEMIDLCSNKLSVLTGPQKPAPVGRPEPPSSPKYCSQCRTQNRSAAEYCIECGATFVATAAAAQVSQQSAPANYSVDIDGTIAEGRPPAAQGPLSTSSFSAPRVSKPVVPSSVYSPQAPTVKPVTSSPAPRPPESLLFGLSAKQMAIIGAGVALVAVLLVVALLSMFKSIRVERAAATVVVSGSKSALYKTPNGSHLLELTPGQQLNVLQIPLSRDQDWVPAQFVPNPKRASKPGFVRVSDLDPKTWQTADPSAKLLLVRIFNSGVSGSDQEIQQNIEALRALQDEISDPSVVSEIHADMAKLYVAQAARLADQGKPPEEWRPIIYKADEEVAAAGNDPAITAQLAPARAKLEALKEIANHPIPTPPPLPQPPPHLIPDLTPSLLDQAERLLNENADQMSNLVKAEAILTKLPAQIADKQLAEKAAKVRDHARAARRLLGG